LGALAGIGKETPATRGLRRFRAANGVQKFPETFGTISGEKEMEPVLLN
jgi:hypothetical protein